MVALFKELQPIDVYTIRMSQPFSEQDQKLLTLFYQPLIGSDAMSLFMTLWADASEVETEYNHYHLMNVLSLPLSPIFEARISLEAIGLLRTYTKTEADQRRFLYELSPPLDAKAFFEDPLLSTFLFSKIGEQAYRSLRSRFIVTIDEKNSGYQEVSRTFLDVYKPVNHRVDVEDVEGRFLGRQEGNDIPFVRHNFDFDLLRSGLSEQMVPQAALSAVSQELIAKLAFLYSLTPLDMQKVIMMALDENLQVPEARLRKAAADFYKMNTSKTPPVLEKTFMQPVAPPVETQEMTREEANIHYLEHTPPAEMLRDYNEGKEPMPVNIQLAERLINTHQLPVGVVNVLLQYVLIRNDGKITKGFVEQIAAHWMSKKISNAREAMEISRKEHDKYMKWQKEEQKPKTFNKQPTREAMVPEWFYEKQEKKETPKKTTKETTKEAANKNESNKTADLEERRRKLREELARTRKGVK